MFGSLVNESEKRDTFVQNPQMSLKQARVLLGVRKDIKSDIQKKGNNRLKMRTHGVRK